MIAEADVHAYATLPYAETLAHVGQPIHVPAWQTYVIARELGGHARDAMGPYPLACLGAESDLRGGVETLRAGGFVSITLIVDGVVGPSLDRFRETMSLVRPFKAHYLFDPASGPYRPSSHHRYEIRRAVKQGVDVQEVALGDVLEPWTALYDELIVRRGITGVQRFGRASFQALARCRGLRTIAAFLGGDLVSCHLWFEYAGHVWSHLAVSSTVGYATGAAYAVHDYSIRSFHDRVIDMGGNAGTADSAADGLARFKSGFANRTSTAYLVGAVLAPGEYRRLCEANETARSDYFPAYRAPAVHRAAAPTSGIGVP